MAYFRNKRYSDEDVPPKQLPRADPQQEPNPQEEPDDSSYTIEEVAKLPGGKEVLLEMGISAQIEKNKRTQEWNARLAEPLVDKNKMLGGYGQYIPDWLWGAAKGTTGRLAQIGNNVATMGGTVPPHPFFKALQGPDPFEKISTAGRFGGGEPLSLASPEGNAYMFGPSGGSGSAETAGNEIAKFLEMSVPGGSIKRGVAAVPEYMKGPVRSFLEAINAYGQAKLQGQDPVSAAEWAAFMPALGRLFARSTETAAPGVSESLSKRGRSFYGGIFEPSGKREKAIARRAVEPLITARKGYFGDRVQLGEGIFTTKGQVERFARDKIDATKAAKQAEILRRPGGQNFLMSYDDFESSIDRTIKNELMETNVNTGVSDWKSDAAREAARHLEGMKNRARNISQPGPGGVRQIPYKNLMGFKDEADDALAKAGAFAENRGATLSPDLRGGRHFAGEAREATAREAPEIFALDQQISKWSTVMEGARHGELREFGRTKGVGAPVVTGIGQEDPLKRAGTYGLWSLFIRTWERVKTSPAVRTGVGKGIMINTANALKRGDFDGAASQLGRLAAKVLPESEIYQPIHEKERFKVKDEYDYDPNSGGLVPRVKGKTSPTQSLESPGFYPKKDKGDEYVDVEGVTHTRHDGRWEREQ